MTAGRASVTRAAAGLLALIGVWAAAIALIRPVGNFPLLDDWIYAYGVQSLATRGVLEFSPYMEATGIAQVLWGWLFASIGGSSFDVLRVSTLVLVPMGIGAVWLTAIELGATAATAVCAAAVFAFNPIALTLAPTFMTDLPFTVCSAVACLCFFRALARPTWRIVIGATMFATLAVFVRQQGLAWPAAFVPAALLALPRSRRSRAMAVTPLAAAGGAFLLYSYWLTASGLRPSGGDVHVGKLFVLLWRGWGQDWLAFPKTALNIGFHWGWYVLPFVVWTSSRASSRVRNGAIVLAVVASAVLVTGKVAPWGSAVLYDLGIGPVMLEGVDRGEVASIPRAPRWIWVVWTIAAAWSASALILRIARELRRWTSDAASSESGRRGQIVFGVAGLLIFATPMVLVGFCDRYLLATLPIACGLCVLLLGRDVQPARVARAAAAALVCLYAAFGVAAAHDYFAWNRARWQAIDSLLASGYRLEQVNGGNEYAGLHGMHVTGLPLNMPHAVVVIALEKLQGTVVCGSFPFRRWMPAREDRVWVLGRDAAACRSGS